MEQGVHVENEKFVLSTTNYHLIPRLYAAWHTPTHFCMALELVQGGELFSLMQKNGRFGRKSAAFYCGCAAAAIGHLHERGIVYRDLKPENILIDAQGYAKLTDMGFAKVVVGKTFTLCGTPDYMAPEIINGTGHHFPSDWWSLGVLLYECMVGITPFQADGELQIFERAQKADYKLPWMFPRDASDLIQKLLHLQDDLRLGHANPKHSNSVFACDFFKGLDLSELNKRSIVAPHIPVIGSSTDASCFDESFLEDDEVYDADREEILTAYTLW